MPEEHDPEPETTSETPVGEDPQVVAGRYRILRTLGRGGGGIVWLAKDEHLGREVALKRVAGEADAEVLVTRGLREARTSAALAHHHVVRVYDAFEHEGSPWIVMEHVPGPSLSALLEGGRALPVGQVARIGAQVATALAAAHGAGVVHRDVKPGNVLLTDESGQDAKLTDFGIARAEDDHQLTRTGMVSGTAAYFSPELARGEDPSAASDVWALGATLYAAVEGRRPYRDAGNPVAQLHLIAREAPDAPRLAGPLEPVLRGMLDPDPTRRWTAERAARALSEVAQGRPPGGAGAAASAPAAGAAAATTWQRDGADGDVTRQVSPDATRRVPVPASAPAVGRPPAPVRKGGDHAYAARPRTPSVPPAGRGGRRRTPVVLGWLLGVPLALLLGWLVWTIATGERPGPDGATTTSTAPQGGAVSVEEAEGVIQAFYSELQTEGLDTARQHLSEQVFADRGVAEDIDEGLTSVDLSPPASEQVGDDVRSVVRATYTYGTTVIVQDDTLVVSRVDGQPLIVRRSSDLVSNAPTEGSDPAGGGEEAPEDGDPGEGDPGEGDPAEGTGDGDGNGNGNGNNGNGYGDGDDGAGSTAGDEGGGNGGPGNGGQGRDG